MKKELVCIVCPMGCRMIIEKNDDEDSYKVIGNNCKRGEKYAVKELINPTRVVTSTVKINSIKSKRLSIKTNDGIPKELIFECMKKINDIEVNAPIKVGDILIHNIFSTGVDIVSTKCIDK